MKLACCVLILIFSLQMFGQQTTPAENPYLQKSKNQKKVAWVLLGGGILSAGLGSFRFQNADGSYGNSRNTLFTVVGVTAIGASVPLFIASSKNKKKSVSLSMSLQTYQLNKVAYRNVPNVHFGFTF